MAKMDANARAIALETAWELFLAGKPLKQAAKEAGVRYAYAWTHLKDRPGYQEAQTTINGIKPEVVEVIWERFLAGTPLKAAAREADVCYSAVWKRVKDRDGYAEALVRSRAANGRTPVNHVPLDVQALLARYLAGETRDDLSAAFGVSPNTIYDRLRVFPEYLEESRRRKAAKSRAAWHALPEAERPRPPAEARKRALKAFWGDAERRTAMFQTRKDRHGQRFFEDLGPEDRAQILAQFRAHVAMKKLAKRYKVTERAISRFIQSILTPAEFERVKAETFARRFPDTRPAAVTDIHRPGTAGNARSKGKRHLYRVRVPAIR